MSICRLAPATPSCTSICRTGAGILVACAAGVLFGAAHSLHVIDLVLVKGTVSQSAVNPRRAVFARVISRPARHFGSLVLEDLSVGLRV